jgi:hypothetical protein
MATLKFSVEDFEKGHAANSQDVEKTMLQFGMSKATFYRYMGLVKQKNGGAVAPKAVHIPKAAAPVLDAGALNPDDLVIEAKGGPAALPAPHAEGGAKLGREKSGALNVGLVPDGVLDLSPYIPKLTGEIKGYKPRQPYFDALKAYAAIGEPALMVGEAGTGKTSLARYLAHTLSYPFLEVSCDALLGFQELFGAVNITDGTSHFIEGLFLKFIQTPSIILIDEANALDPAKSFKLHQLLESGEVFVKEADRGRGKLYQVNDKCFIILAGNPPTGKYNGVNRWNVALLDRPLGILEIDEFTQAELDAIIPKHAEKAKLVRFYNESREVIRKDGLRTTFSIRSVKRVLAHIDMGFGMREALLFGFLNAVKQTAGQEAFGALYKLATLIWNIEAIKI